MTKAADDCAPRPFRLIVAFVWASLLLVSGLVLAVRLGFMRSDLNVNQQKLQQEAKSADQRSRTLREEQKRQRSQLAVDPAQAKVLHQQEERRQSQKLARRMENIRGHFDAMKVLQERQLKKIAERSLADINRQLALKAQAIASQLKDLAERNQGWQAHPERESLLSQTGQLKDLGDRLAEHSSDPRLQQDLNRLAKEVSRHAGQNADAPRDKTKSNSLGQSFDRELANKAQSLLTLVDRLAGPPPDLAAMNDRSIAHQAQPPPPVPPEAGSAGNYAAARQLEAEMAKMYQDIRAVENALADAASFPQAAQELGGVELPDRPESIGLDNGGLNTMGQLNEARQATAAAVQQIQSIESNAGRLQAQARQLVGGGGDGVLANQLRDALFAQASRPGGGNLAALMQAHYGRGGGGFGGGDGVGGEILRSEAGGLAMTAPAANPESLRIDQRQIDLQALPGRRFSANASRHGWLYLDTFYSIGPWENHGGLDFSLRHPPEEFVDLDAEYIGKKGQKLTWQFLQSNNLRVIPLNPCADGTWYFYTELEFEQDQEMLISVGSDDTVRVWVNGLPVWMEPNRQSNWSIGEGARNVCFRRGVNRVLVRLENGPHCTLFSLLVCPVKAAKPKK
jgi:hypothetical protein